MSFDSVLLHLRWGCYDVGNERGVKRETSNDERIKEHDHSEMKVKIEFGNHNSRLLN